jgi:hypothetical protein
LIKIAVVPVHHIYAYTKTLEHPKTHNAKIEEGIKMCNFSYGNEDFVLGYQVKTLENDLLSFKVKE